MRWLFLQPISGALFPPKTAQNIFSSLAKNDINDPDPHQSMLIQMLNFVWQGRVNSPRLDISPVEGDLFLIAARQQLGTKSTYQCWQHCFLFLAFLIFSFSFMFFFSILLSFFLFLWWEVGGAVSVSSSRVLQVLAKFSRNRGSTAAEAISQNQRLVMLMRFRDGMMLQLTPSRFDKSERTISTVFRPAC